MAIETLEPEGDGYLLMNSVQYTNQVMNWKGIRPESKVTTKQSSIKRLQTLLHYSYACLKYLTMISV